MTKKDKFIELVKVMMENTYDMWDEVTKNEYAPALEYFNGLQAGDDKAPKKMFTENGKLILNYMQENKDTVNNLFKAKDIGEGLGISSRTVSGAMRKLVTDGYCEKTGNSPTVYSITAKGIGVDLDKI